MGRGGGGDEPRDAKGCTAGAPCADFFEFFCSFILLHSRKKWPLADLANNQARWFSEAKSGVAGKCYEPHALVAVLC